MTSHPTIERWRQRQSLRSLEATTTNLLRWVGAGYVTRGVSAVRVRGVGTWLVAALMLTWWALFLGLGLVALLGGAKSI